LVNDAGEMPNTFSLIVGHRANRNTPLDQLEAIKDQMLQRRVV